MTIWSRVKRSDVPEPAAWLKDGLFFFGETVSMSFQVPIIIMLLTIGLAVLIYWGGFAEERRARKG